MDEIKNFNGIDYIVGNPKLQNSGEIYKVSNRWKIPQEIFWCCSNHEYRIVSYLQKENYIWGLYKPGENGFFYKKDSVYKDGHEYFLKNLELWSFKEDPFVPGKNISNEKFLSNYFQKSDNTYGLKTINHGKLKYSTYDIEKYSYKDIPADYKKIYEILLNDGKSKFPKLEKLFQKSIGIEFETSCGHLKEDLCKDLGLIPVKDGSISGHEYITLPYKKNVIQKAIDACVALRYGTAIDSRCSTHVHIGGLRTDRVFVASLYELWSYVQDEFYELIVVNKRSVGYINNKAQGPKDHCKPVPKFNYLDLKSHYKNIFTLFNSSLPPSNTYHRGKLAHDSKQKWNIDCRYYNLNMINLLNGNDVVEFRIHGPTLNEVKLVNYLLILNAVIEFASKYSNIVMHRKEKLYLEKIIKVIYANHPDISKTLINYINHRKNLYINNIFKDDIWGEELQDLTPPDDCNVLKLFGYSVTDNEYQNEIDLVKTDLNYSVKKDDYSFDHHKPHVGNHFNVLNIEHDFVDEGDDDDEENEEELFEGEDEDF